RLGVVRFQVIVRDRPRRRDAAVMMKLLEVSLAQTKQSRAVEFSIAAYIVICVWVKLPAVLVAPLFFRLILAFEVDSFRAPVVLLSRHIVAALEDKNALARWSQLVGKRSAACARPDNYHVEVVCVCHSFPSSPKKSVGLFVHFAALRGIESFLTCVE